MKSKIKYGLKEYFRPTPSKIKRLLLAWKTIIGGSAAVAMADSDWKLAILIGMIGFVVNEAAMFVGEHPEFFAVEEAKNAIKDQLEEVAKEIKEEKVADEFNEKTA